MPVDASDIDWEWQAMHLRLRLTEIDGDAFESFFQDIGRALWGSVFQATIPMAGVPMLGMSTSVMADATARRTLLTHSKRWTRISVGLWATGKRC
jgi:hypothetical protein